MKTRNAVSLVILAALLLFGGLSLLKSYATSTVADSLQMQFDKDEKFKEYQLKVGEVNLFRKSLFSFEGIATVTMDGESHNIGLDVTMDGMNVLWKTQPFSMAFLAKKDLENMQREFEANLKKALTPDPADQLQDSLSAWLLQDPEIQPPGAEAELPEEPAPLVLEPEQPVSNEEISDAFSKY